MQKFPFLTLNQSLILLRVSLAIIFWAHAIVRLVNGTIPQFAAAMNSKGFPFAIVLVWMITIFEITGGIALVLNYCVKWLSAAFILLLVAGIIIIHFSLGWFVGEHGTGGSEYSFILIMCFVVLAAGTDKK